MNWTRADLTDVTAITELAQRHFAQEVDMIFTIEPRVFAYNLSLNIVNQMFDPYSALVLACKNDQGQVVAYTWATRNERAVWSSEEMVAVRMAHVGLDLSTRDRVRLIQEMMGFWEVWAVECSIPVVCSTTMRQDQAGFLKLHTRAGYSVRGSIAYKRLNHES